MEVEIDKTVQHEAPRVNYTVFDRKLITAKLEGREVSFVLSKAAVDPTSGIYWSYITTRIVSVDKYFIEVFCVEMDRNIWVNKKNIASASIEIVSVDPPAEDV